jgi:hypothetical protein
MQHKRLQTIRILLIKCLEPMITQIYKSVRDLRSPGDCEFISGILCVCVSLRVYVWEIQE